MSERPFRTKLVLVDLFNLTFPNSGSMRILKDNFVAGRLMRQDYLFVERLRRMTSCLTTGSASQLNGRFYKIQTTQYYTS